MTDTDHTDPETEPPRLLIIDTSIVGTRFYRGAAELLVAIGDDDSFALIREPDNKYDKNAIAVYVDDTKCGHIPAPQAKFLAPLLDAGAKILSIKRHKVTGLILTVEKAEEED